jgi:hypothetical protein
MTRSKNNTFFNPALYDSTAGMTLYNLLAQHGGQYDADQLYDMARSAQHPELERDQCDRALVQLVRRRWISEVEGRYKCLDPKRRLVVDRDRSGVQAMMGVIDGGWSGWMVREPVGQGRFQQRRLEMALDEEHT